MANATAPSLLAVSATSFEGDSGDCQTTPCPCSICSRYTPDIGNTAAAVAVGDGPILKEHRWPGVWAHEPAYETASSLLLVSVSLFDSRSYQSGDDTEEV